MEFTFEELFHRLPTELTDAMKNSRQSPIWHPEGPCDIHVRIVFELAQKNFPEDKELLLAAIFHDLGKPETQKISFVDGVEKISNFGHEVESLKYIERFFDIYSDISTNYEKVYYICENHMKMHLYLRGAIKNKTKIDKLVNNQWFESLKHFTFCDEMRGTIYCHTETNL